MKLASSGLPIIVFVSDTFHNCGAGVGGCMGSRGGVRPWWEVGCFDGQGRRGEEVSSSETGCFLGVLRRILGSGLERKGGGASAGFSTLNLNPRLLCALDSTSAKPATEASRAH